jgi:hypothetical protein
MMRRLNRSGQRAAAWRNPRVSVAAEDDSRLSTEGTRYTLAYGQYTLAYEVYGSGDRVLVWLHGLLLDSNLSRSLARSLAARGNRASCCSTCWVMAEARSLATLAQIGWIFMRSRCCAFWTASAWIRRCLEASRWAPT